MKNNMKVGDLVKWIGFPGATLSPSRTGPVEAGIIIKIYALGQLESDERIDVMWGDYKVGTGLYPETIEVINEII